MTHQQTYAIAELQKALNAVFNGDEASRGVNALLIDSRKLTKPEGVLFVAINGSRHNGLDYVEDLYQKGVRDFVVERLPENRFLFEGANFLIVKDALLALQQLAIFHREHYDIPVIGITGSNGKTIVKEWLFQVLQSIRSITRSPKSYNSQVGVPLSVWAMNKEHELAIFEAGISEPHEMEQLESIIKPNIGLFTNIGQAHGRFFTDVSQKIKEKLMLFKDCDKLIYCLDHLLIDNEIIASDYPKEKLFTWSAYREADLQILKVISQHTNTKIEAQYQDEILSIEIPFVDKASIENAIHCWAILLLLDIDHKHIRPSMSKLVPIAMRLEMKNGVNGCLLINDVYSSDIESFKIALDFVNQQQQSDKTTVVLSDMIGGSLEGKELYEEVASLLDKYEVQRLIGVGRDLRTYRTLFTQKLQLFDTTEDLLKNLASLKFSNETILLKGARRFAFEDVSQVLSQKAHTTVLEVDLNALVLNYQYFKAKLDPETRVMAMVKAFSYGTGSTEIANVLQFHRVDYLGVAYADEGVELRKSGIEMPIMVMNPEVDSFEQMIRYDLEPEIFSFEVLRQFYDVIKLQPSSKVYGLHLKIDTGMHRLGFHTDDVTQLLLELAEMPRLKVISIFSHLAASDQPDLEVFTQSQFACFDAAYEQLVKGLAYKPIKHILNSSGVENYTAQQYDMVRLGIGMYGIGSSPNLRPVARLKTKISQIKKIRQGDSVGYNRGHFAKNDMKIAILPIGYADGLNRKLGYKVGEVYVSGERRPIIGAVCMDMCFVDVTDLMVSVRDEIELFGEHVSIKEWADKLETIPYEILTSVSRRVKRVYFQE